MLTVKSQPLFALKPPARTSAVAGPTAPVCGALRSLHVTQHETKLLGLQSLLSVCVVSHVFSIYSTFSKSFLSRQTEPDSFPGGAVDDAAADTSRSQNLFLAQLPNMHLCVCLLN